MTRAALRVLQLGKDLDVGAGLLDPVLARDAEVEQTVLDVRRDLLGAEDGHALDPLVVDRPVVVARGPTTHAEVGGLEEAERLLLERTLRDDESQHGRRSLPVVHSAVEAGPLAGVAGGTELVDANEQHVCVAVGPDLLDVLDVAGGLPLAPPLLPGAAPEHRSPQRLPVHPGQHEDLAVLGVLDDRGDQAPVVERELVLVHRHVLTGMPSSCRCRLISEIVSSRKWKRDAARAASARPAVSASTKCSAVPAPPLATIGTLTASATARVSSTS